MVQKVRIQICLEQNAINRLEGYRQEFMCKNYNDTLPKLLKKMARMEFIVEQLEQKAKEMEGWKKKAENPGGMSGISTIVADVKKNTDSKQKSGENTKDIVKPKGVI